MAKNDNDIYRLQLSIGSRSTTELQEWAKNQGDDLTKSARIALEHFVELYGTEHIDEKIVKYKMAKNLMNVFTNEEQGISERPNDPAPLPKKQFNPKNEKETTSATKPIEQSNGSSEKEDNKPEIDLENLNIDI